MKFDEFKNAVIEAAKKAGLQEYELYYMEESSESVASMAGAIEEFSSDVTGGASFRCKSGGKMGYCSTEQFSAEEALRLVEKAMENAATIETEDEGVIFAGSPSYQEIKPKETKLSSMAEMSKLALDLYDAAVKVDDKVQKSSQAQIAQGTTKVRLVNSSGLDLSSESTQQVAFQSAVVRSGEEQFNSYEKENGPFDKIDVEKLAKKAVEKALDKISGAPVPSGSYPVVFDNTCFASLLAAFSGIFSAKNAQQGMSLLAGKEDQTIASEIVTLTDDPFYEEYETAFDGEGVATYRKNVIENGVFKTLLYNLTFAKKAGRETTGNGSRASYYAPVEIAPFNFYLLPGEKEAEKLYEQASADGDGLALLITDLAGLHAGLNPITGDFSLMASGYRLENGKKTTFVNGITVSGNFYELLKSIRLIGKDLDFGGFPHGFTRFGSPSIYVGKMPVAGK
ncbi:MAG: TldD/PmbA family protein [Firmicutes bacterium]|nr:TldD/PmbA family protein [Bacillota bacterium]